VSYPVARFTDGNRRSRVTDARNDVEQILLRHAERYQIPGLAYGVVLDGALILDDGVGVANVETRAAANADTVFRIASMSKSFAAAALLQLRDVGRLQLDAPVATYVPELSRITYPTTDAAPLSVRDLLTMSAGWPEDDAWADRQLHRDADTISAWLAADPAWAYPPGVTFEYSNFGYMVLGRVISAAAGMPALEYIARQLLEPLGMQTTMWNPDAVPAERLARGYDTANDTWTEQPLLPCVTDAAVFGGLYSTVRDMARWIAFLLSAWPPRDDDDVGPLRRSSLREMQQGWRASGIVLNGDVLAQPTARGHANGYGYGLGVIDNGHWSTVGHGGGLPGFGSHMRWAPAYGLGIVALSNATYTNMYAPCRDVLALLIGGKRVTARVQQPSPALEHARDIVNRLLVEWDDALAATLLADNFFLDHEHDAWVREWAALRDKHGALTPDGELETEHWLSGEWRMTGERGWCRIDCMLTPTAPPRVQHLEVTSVLPPSPALADVADRLIGLIARPRRRELMRLCAREADRDAIWDRVRVIHVTHGGGQIGELLGGDGERSMRAALTGGKREGVIEVKVDARGKLTDLIVTDQSAG
jgi:CubicO group peptidase (beta-lactamase class C family)